MYDIKLKINGDGTIETEKAGVLHLGARGSRASVRFTFEIDPTIEGEYRYIKFHHPHSTVLQRLVNNVVIISTNVFAHTGIWLVSFLSSDKYIGYQGASGSYVFSSIPIECHVCEGLLTFDISDENVRRITELENEVSDLTASVRKIVEMDYTTLEIPECVEKIGNYFMYNNSLDIDRLVISRNVREIGGYCFYGSDIQRIEFAPASQIQKFNSYAFSHVNTGNFVIPASLSDYGRYVLQGGSADIISFNYPSQVRTINANAFNNVTAGDVVLPYGMTKFATNGYVFRNCRINYIWIPSTLTSPIPQTAFFEADGISEIDLESGFNVSANFSNCTQLTHQCLVDMLDDLSDRNGQAALSLTLGATNLAKLTEAEKRIALNKNWTLS